MLLSCLRAYASAHSVVNSDSVSLFNQFHSPSIKAHTFPKRRALHRFAMQQCVTTAGRTFFLDPFAARQWDDPEYKGTRLSTDKVQFVERLHELYSAGTILLRDGYAPFCKHLFVENFVGARSGTVPITEANVHLLKSDYTKRRPEELAVLTRWFAKDEVEAPIAMHLDVILYSRDQIVKEAATLKGGSSYAIPDIPWGIISIKAQMEDYETPMNPITILRNALGTEHGGSGVPIDVDNYNASVEYWQRNAIVM